MPRNVPSLKPKKLIRVLESAGCTFYREGKRDHRLYILYAEGKKRVVPIDMGPENFPHRMFCGSFGNLDSMMKK